MKTIFTAAFAILLAVGPVQAQSTSMGVRGDFSLSTFRGDTNQLKNALVGQGGSGDFARRRGFRYGGFLRFRISDMFAVRPEVTYSQKGTTFETESSGYSGSQIYTASQEFTARYDYLSIPVLFEFRIPISQGSGTPIEPFLFAGPSLSFLLKSKTEVKSTFTSGGSTQTSTNTSDDDIDSTSFSGIIGAGLSWLFSSGNVLSLEAHYNPGISTLNPDSDIDLQNDVVNIGLAYSFTL